MGSRAFFARRGLRDGELDLRSSNITCPTGFRAIKALGGPDVAAATIRGRIEAKRS